MGMHTTNTPNTPNTYKTTLVLAASRGTLGTRWQAVEKAYLLATGERGHLGTWKALDAITYDVTMLVPVANDRPREERVLVTMPRLPKDAK